MSEQKQMVRKTRRRAARREQAHHKCFALSLDRDNKRIKWRCSRCQHVFNDTFNDKWNVDFLAKLVASHWGTRGGGCGVCCPACLKKRYDVIDRELKWGPGKHGVHSGS